MSNTVTLPQVVAAINAGNYTSIELRTMVRIAKARLTRLQLLDPSSKLNEVRVGDLVKFNSKVSPSYLIGLVAQVVKVNRTRVKVKFVDKLPSDRFTGLVNTSTSLFDIVK